MSADPWTHEYLTALAKRLTDGKLGTRVRVRRYMQPPLEGELMRVSAGTLILSGHGVIPAEQIEAVDVLA